MSNGAYKILTLTKICQRCLQQNNFLKSYVDVSIHHIKIYFKNSGGITSTEWHMTNKKVDTYGM
jgi:hypothetical protein